MIGSTVMDSYLALSGKTINTLKQEYSEYESENYRIVPDNEAECFDIYNKDGEEGFIWADLEIKGMAKRTDQGYLNN